MDIRPTILREAPPCPPPSTASNSAERATATSPTRAVRRLPARGQALGDDVDRDVLALEQRIGGGEHDRRDQQVAGKFVDPRHPAGSRDSASRPSSRSRTSRRAARPRRAAMPSRASARTRRSTCFIGAPAVLRAARVQSGRRRRQIFFSSSMIFGPPSGADLRNASTTGGSIAPRHVACSCADLHVHRHALAGEVLERGGRGLLGHGDRVLLDLGRRRLDRLLVRGRQLRPTTPGWRTCGNRS